MEFRHAGDAEPPRWGPPCRRCDDLTELVSLTDAPAPPPAAPLDAPPAAPSPESERETPSRANGRSASMEPVGAAVPRSRRLPAPLLILSEYWYARRRSRLLLALHDAVRQQQPMDSNRARYEEVVVRWRGLDRHSARALLHRAEQSMSAWESGQSLRFRDVVLYVVFDDYQRAHPDRHGARSRMGRTVARVIPAAL